MMHEKFLRMAIQMAKEGRDSPDGGAFGALIVRNEEIICKVHNRVKGEDDLTQHAELAAIQAACAKIGKNQLKDCILYTSCEPCLMCLGACYWAKFKEIYFGASAEDAKEYGYIYSQSYYNMDAELRHSEFKMVQLLREEAIDVWK